jgi:AraC-like DNA-binding protein
MQNFKEEINVNQYAEMAGMTTTSFYRFFKKQTNVSFTVYLNYLRINMAWILLRKTSIPVKGIAYEYGVASVVYFNQKFRKISGMSPGVYGKK